MKAAFGSTGTGRAPWDKRRCGSLEEPSTHEDGFDAVMGEYIAMRFQMYERQMLDQGLKVSWPKRAAAVLLRGNFTCSYCGKRGTHMEVDHVTPVELGGSDALENLVAACHSCNCAKGPRTVEGWRAGVPFGAPDGRYHPFRGPWRLGKRHGRLTTIGWEHNYVENRVIHHARCDCGWTGITKGTEVLDGMCAACTSKRTASTKARVGFAGANARQPPGQKVLTRARTGFE